ncbi:hypothetical protein [Sorangium sp. So ce385]
MALPFGVLVPVLAPALLGSCCGLAGGEGIVLTRSPRAAWWT